MLFTASLKLRRSAEVFSAVRITGNKRYRRAVIAQAPRPTALGPPYGSLTKPGFPSVNSRQIMVNKKLARWTAGAITLVATIAPAGPADASSPVTVNAAARPGGTFEAYPTRTLEQLPEAVRNQKDSRLSQYGGWLGRQTDATGFFYIKKIDGRWWLVDPEGYLFIHKSVVAVTPLDTPGAQAAFKEKYGDLPTWAARTSALLHEHGFNGLGAWSDTETLRATRQPLVYTQTWNFMSSYGDRRGITYVKPGHTGYPKDCIPVFDPEFEAFCDEYAKQLAATKDDPWLLGHFSDNEMPLKLAGLDNYLRLPAGDPGRQAAIDWLIERHGPKVRPRDIAEQDYADFLKFQVDRYYRIVSRAIRQYDPNHLFLGSRFHDSDLSQPEIFEAAGPYVDVVSVNYYHAWTPDAKQMRAWEQAAGKPCLITEWYAKGMDTGFANTGGAGWLVRTQRDRGRFYENFTLGLMESKVCVGWHWFKYLDNDPADTGADPSNRDGNKGILNNRYEPYPPLLDSMKRINERSYRLVEWFDGTR